jgi:hypothetical protein
MLEEKMDFGDKAKIYEKQLPLHPLQSTCSKLFHNITCGSRIVPWKKFRLFNLQNLSFSRGILDFERGN